jgi:hypothetical protein
MPEPFCDLECATPKEGVGQLLPYYHESRPHLALGKQCPIERQVMAPGAIIAKPEVGGLHHRYEKLAA